MTVPDSLLGLAAGVGLGVVLWAFISVWVNRVRTGQSRFNKRH